MVSQARKRIKHAENRFSLAFHASASKLFDSRLISLFYRTVTMRRYTYLRNNNNNNIKHSNANSPSDLKLLNHQLFPLLFPFFFLIVPFSGLSNNQYGLFFPRSWWPSDCDCSTTTRVRRVYNRTGIIIIYNTHYRTQICVYVVYITPEETRADIVSFLAHKYILYIIYYVHARMISFPAYAELRYVTMARRRYRTFRYLLYVVTILGYCITI